MKKTHIAGPSGGMGSGEGCLRNSCLSSWSFAIVLRDAATDEWGLRRHILETWPCALRDVSWFPRCQRTNEQSLLAGAAHPPTVSLTLHLMHRWHTVFIHETLTVIYSPFVRVFPTGVLPEFYTVTIEDTGGIP